MKLVQWFYPPRVVLTLFICLMALCALSLGWLGWQVLVQDRAVEAQQRREQLESAADRAVAAIERTFAASDAEVTVTAHGEVDMIPAGRLAYKPSQPRWVGVRGDIFAEAEGFEFTDRDRTRATAVYERLAQSGDARVRAETLVRLGRALRRERKWAEALKAYASLETLDVEVVAGMPAGLVAREGRCSVLAESGDSAGARREATVLWTELTSGKWKVTRATLETYLAELEPLASDVSLPADWEERMALAEAAEWAFAQPGVSGREGVLIGGQVVSVSWERHGGAWRAQLGAPSSWETIWSKLELDNGIALHIVDTEGRAIHGDVPGLRERAFRHATMSGLPWSLTATSVIDSATSRSWMARRQFLIVGLLILAVVVSFGSFFIARAIGREFAVAQLQSDFVAAVSHEFRTPLTAIRQLAELLARGRMESKQHKQRAYELMLGESDRLRRLVESLLDFGRMQAREYKFGSESLEASRWSRSITEEFQKTVRSRGYAIEFIAPAQEAWIRGDGEALGGALWNLLDNAVKYSPDDKQIQVAVTSSDGSIEMSVRDHGSGIAREELKRVFGKFYRGTNAKTQGTKGTGIGLAIVKEIVEAHGGTVRVRSEPGQGSEFTMVLPCRES
jgi:signal transduction histidine kinase